MNLFSDIKHCLLKIYKYNISCILFNELRQWVLITNNVDTLAGSIYADLYSNSSWISWSPDRWKYIFQSVSCAFDYAHFNNNICYWCKIYISCREYMYKLYFIVLIDIFTIQFNLIPLILDWFSCPKATYQDSVDNCNGVELWHLEMKSGPLMPN